MKLPWTGREDVVNKISSIIKNNIESHKEKLKAKQYYQFGLITGGTGIGKSRAGIEAVKIGVQEKCFKHHIHIFLDLSRKDKIDNFVDSWYFENKFGNLSKSISIGMRVACNYYFGIGLQDLIVNLNKNEYKLFTIKNVLQLIGEEYKKRKNYYY